MRRTLHLIGLLLVASLTATSPALAALTLGYGTATVDGDFSDWTDATWHPFNAVYDSTPTDITGGEWAAKWTANKVYMAVRVQDTTHIFKDSYTDWAARDGVEMYIHTTGTDTDTIHIGGTDTNVNYGTYQEPAQEWAVGMKTIANGSVWTSVGYSPMYGAPATAGTDYAATPNQFVAAGKIVGDSLYYEAAMAPLKYFGGLRGLADIASPLHAGMTIGVDCTAVSNDGVTETNGVHGYAGMKCSDLGQTIGGWSGVYGNIAQFTLVPEPSTGILAALAAMALAGFAIRRKKA